MKKLIATALLSLPLLVFAQEGFKPGKIDKATVAMGICPYDSSAGAYYILDYGENYLNSALEMVFKRVVRLKILNQSEFEQADITIFHHPQRSVQRLKAYTYNVENGKLVTTELDKDAIFKEKVAEGRSKLTFTFPNVKEGSVIEYSYNVVTGGFEQLDYMDDWYFQGDIPILKSEYHFRFPEFFDYHRKMTGYINLARATVDMENGRLGDEPIRNNHHHYEAHNVPAYEDEDFIRSKSDVISKIGFELKSIDRRGYYTRNFMFNSYGGLANKMLEEDYWSKDIDDASWASDELAVLMTEEDQEANARKIFDYIKNFEKVDESQFSLRGAWKDKNGSDTDLNRILIAVLREAGFSVDPVRIRLRKDGRLDTFYPMYRNFNFTIARLQIGESEFLLDESEKENVFGVLPRYALNDRGLVIKPGPEMWVSLEPHDISGEIVQCKMELSPEGLMEGTLVVRRKGYDAWDFDEKVEKDGKDKYIEDFGKRKESWDIASHEIDDREDEFSNQETIELTVEGQVEDLGNLLYLNPMVYSRWDENPFKKTERAYPVDFGVPYSEMLIAEIALPEGFTVESLPEPLALGLPDNGGTVSYSVQQAENKIMISQRVRITKLEFRSEEYPILREFFARIVEKGGEQIVLKRL